MVENNRTVFKALQDNVAKLKLSNTVLRNEDGLNFVNRAREQFDVIFLDPPFQSDYLPKLMPLLLKQFAPHGLLYIESGSAFEVDTTAWKVYKQGKAGAVHYQLLEIIKND